MQLKNRLKRLEAEVIKEESEFCLCSNGYKSWEYYERHRSKEGVLNEMKLMGKPVLDVCTECGLKIEKQKIIIEFVESNEPKPNGALTIPEFFFS